MLTVGIVYIVLGALIRLLAVAGFTRPNKYFATIAKLFLITGFLEIVVAAVIRDRYRHTMVGGGIVCVMALGMLYLISKASGEAQRQHVEQQNDDATRETGRDSVRGNHPKR